MKLKPREHLPPHAGGGAVGDGRVCDAARRVDHKVGHEDVRWPWAGGEQCAGRSVHRVERGIVAAAATQIGVHHLSRRIVAGRLAPYAIELGREVADQGPRLLHHVEAVDPNAATILLVADA